MHAYPYHATIRWMLAVLLIACGLGTSAAATSLPRAVSPTAKPGPLPKLLAEVPLVPGGATLQDLLLDSANNRLYVTDSEGQLHILDTTTLVEVATLPGSGALVLDGEGGRLYASSGQTEEVVTVIDTASAEVVGIVSPGGQVTVDSSRGRFYVGNPIYGDPPEGAPGVRVYDAATFEKMGEIPQPGLPTYNPVRDEIVIVAYTAHLADPETLRVTGDLLPEITAQPLAWCTGCTAVRSAHAFPERNLLMLEMATLSAGKGPGRLPAPRFFDATTLAELTDWADLPGVEQACEGRFILADPLDARVYRGASYSRYVAHNNLLVYDLDGSLVTWRDGLALGVTNPNTKQMYAPRRNDVLVLDLATLLPVGTLPPVCIHTLDHETGRIFGTKEGNLLVFSEEGDWLVPEPPVEGGPLPTEQVVRIHPSPAYAADQTLFVIASGGNLYRSTDDGRSWVQLRGGVPRGDYLSLHLAISPQFATDGTLFAGGFRGDFQGEGVYRSTDGGDTWQPMWDGLAHLRVYEVAVSPDYGADGTLLAYARYYFIGDGQSGLSVYQSNDGALNWTLVMTRPQGSSLPPPGALLPDTFASSAQADGSNAAVQIRRGPGAGLERTTDGGHTWQPLVIAELPEQPYVKTILSSPDGTADSAFYLLMGSDLLRSTDGGETWERWDDERLNDRDYSSELATAEVSPLLGDGRYCLFVGTLAGEFWTLDPWSLRWQDLSGPPIACRNGPARAFASTYAAVGERLGCADTQEVLTNGAYQPFQRGSMFWRADIRTIHVLTSDGVWAEYLEDWCPGFPEHDPSLDPPPGLFQPVRGFGKVWREELGGPEATIGWAVAQETDSETLVQPFDEGLMLADAQGAVYVLYADGTWELR